MTPLRLCVFASYGDFPHTCFHEKRPIFRDEYRISTKKPVKKTTLYNIRMSILSTKRILTIFFEYKQSQIYL